MNRRTKKWLRRNAKILAVCGGMIYLASGVAKLAAEPQESEVPKMVFAQIPEKTVIPRETPEVPEETAEPVEAGYYTIVMSRDWDADDSYRLAKLAMAEAEGEDTEGKALVVMVVLNRVWSDDFPGTIEEVIMEEHDGVHQFSVTQEEGRWWKVEPDADCYEAVEMVMAGWDERQGALYFESRSDSVWHQKNLDYLFQHGSHFFYKDKEE